MSANPHEDANRTRKATVLADYLDAAKISAESAEGLGTAGGAIVAQLAGQALGRTVHPPSADTWAEVVQMLRGREAARRFARTKGIARLVAG